MEQLSTGVTIQRGIPPLTWPATRLALSEGEPRVDDRSRVPVPQPDFNRKEQIARYSVDWVIRLGLNDAPNVIAVLAHVIQMPGWLQCVVTGSDMLNVASSIPAPLCGLREIRDTFRNPLATRTDKIVDAVNLGSDVVSLVGAAMPLVASINSPLMAGIFFGTQLAGIGINIAKTAYDYHRKGQQSAYREGQTAVAGPRRSPRPVLHWTRAASAQGTAL